MQLLSQTDMMEATRLTREGRLEEAMALLQGKGRPTSPAASDSSNSTESTKPSVSQAPPLIDMVPPSASGGAWTAPSMKGSAFGGGGSASSPPEMPTGLRGLMDRMGGLGAMEGSGAGLSETLMSKLGGSFGGATQRVPVALPDGARFEERLYTNGGA